MTGVDAARAAAGAGAWQDVLAALDDAGEDSDEAVELRATALYATGDLESCLAAWERLHARLAASGDREGSARAAAMTALFLLIDTGLMAPFEAGRRVRSESSATCRPAGCTRCSR